MKVTLDAVKSSDFEPFLCTVLEIVVAVLVAVVFIERVPFIVSTIPSSKSKCETSPSTKEPPLYCAIFVSSASVVYGS